VAWSVCTPAEIPLVNQLNLQEKNFLVVFSKYIISAMESPMSVSDPSTVLSDILMTARHRLSLLSKECDLSPNFIVVSTVLLLLSNLFSIDNMKYKSLEQFQSAYPFFSDRAVLEQEKLYHTANWMHILFQITTAKKNKGMVMEVIPRFVEGNSVQYVTGSGQTQPTRDRVTVYETEGNVKPVKRLKRASKKQTVDVVKHINRGKSQSVSGGGSGEKKKRKAEKKATYEKAKFISLPAGGVTVSLPSRTSTVQFLDAPKEECAEDFPAQQEPSIPSVSSNYHQYLPLPLSFLMPPPMPVRRSQSSFSQAAAAIASFNQTVVQGLQISTTTTPSPSFLCSPKECYLDVEDNGSLRKTTSATWGANSTSSISLMHSTSYGSFDSADFSAGEHGFKAYPDCQLQMLREVSEGSDFSSDDNQSSQSVIPPFLQELITPGSRASSQRQCAPPDVDVDVDFELLEILSAQTYPSWQRNSSASSLSGRDSAVVAK